MLNTLVIKPTPTSTTCTYVPYMLFEYESYYLVWVFAARSALRCDRLAGIALASRGRARAQAWPLAPAAAPYRRYARKAAAARRAAGLDSTATALLYVTHITERVTKRSGGLGTSECGAR